MTRLNYISQILFSCMFLVREGHRGDSWGNWRAQGKQQLFFSSYTMSLICWLTLMIWGKSSVPALPSPGSSYGFSDSWATYVCSVLWWRIPDSAKHPHHQIRGNRNRKGVSSSYGNPACSWMFQPTLIFSTLPLSFLNDCMPCGYQAPASDVETTDLQGPVTQLPWFHDCIWPLPYNKSIYLPIYQPSIYLSMYLYIHLSTHRHTQI